MPNISKKCDFCADELKKVFWEHPCEDFTADLIVIVGDNIVHETQEVYGAWLACIPCHMMVSEAIRLQNAGKEQETQEAVRQMALRSRGRWISRRPGSAPEQREAYLGAAIETINSYLQHREGQPVRHGGPTPQHG